MILLSVAAAFSGGAALTGLWRWLQHPAEEAAPDGGRLPSRTREGTAAEGPPPPLPAGWARYGGARPEPRGYPVDSVLAVRGLEKQPPDVVRQLLDVADALGMPVDTLAAVIAHESGWNPEALYFRDKNDDGTPRKVPFVAAGLCQLTVEAHLEGFGSWEKVREVATWSVERQLREVVLPLWAKYGGRVRQAPPGVGLMLNFLPDKAGAPEGTVLGEKDAKGFSGRVYAMNRGFDVGGDGKITVGDVYASAARVCRAAKGRRVRADGSIWTPPRPFVKTASPAPGVATVATAVTNAATAATSSEPAAAPGGGDSPQIETVAAPGSIPSAGRSGVLRLGDRAGGLLLAAIRAGFEEPPTWVDLLWEGRGKTAGVRLVLRVSAHAVRAPVEVEGLGRKLLRLPLSYREQLEICRLRRWFPLTQTISDAIWAAGRRLKPPLLGKWDTPEEQKDSSRRMMTMEWVVAFNKELDRQIPEGDFARLAAPEGKDWIVHPRIERPDGKGAINYGLHRLDGTPWQTPGGMHDWLHYDESQTLRAMEWEGTDPVTGQKVPIVEVLRTAGMPAAVLAPFDRIAAV